MIEGIDQRQAPPNASICQTGAQLLQDADETLPQPRRERMLLIALSVSIKENYVDHVGQAGEDRNCRTKVTPAQAFTRAIKWNGKSTI